MKIRDVLAGKSRRLHSVRPDTPVVDFPKHFADNNISSVLIIDARDHLRGIVTDRLFLAAMPRYGFHFSSLEAEDIMQSPAPSCAPDDLVTDAMRKMTDDRLRHLVVLDGGKLVGIVSIGDLVKARLSDFEIESKVLRELALGQMAAR